MYLSTDEAATLLGHTTPRLRRWCQSGMIKTSTIPLPSGRKRYYILKSDLLAFAVSMKLSASVIKKIKEVEEKK